jgi:hypothetical protein
MKLYLIKYNQPYSEQDSDVFEKGLVKIEDKFLPVKLNWVEIVGRAKFFSDEIGVYVKKIKYQQGKVKIDFSKDLKVEFGFIVEDFEIKDNVRHLKKIKLMELSIRQ